MECDGRGWGRICAFSDGALVFLFLESFFLRHEFEIYLGIF